MSPILRAPLAHSSFRGPEIIELEQQEQQQSWKPNKGENQNQQHQPRKY